MAGRNAHGMGNIRKKAKVDKKTGKKYEWWEARYTAGRDPGTGKQRQRTITGKTQKEVAQKLAAVLASIDSGTYIAPSKQTVGQWLDTWAETYLGGVKPHTVVSYKAQIANHIKPAIGAVRLEALDTPTIQQFYNQLAKTGQRIPKRGKSGEIIKRDGRTVYENVPLSPKTIKNIHGVLHKALQQAVLLNYIRYNPTTACVLPKIVKKEIHPLTDQQTAQLLNLLKGSKYEIPLTVDLFTGLREGELLGLMWDCVDFEKGTILVNKQLRRSQRKGGTYYFSPPKNNKSRTITPAPYVMKLLQAQKVQQAEQRLMAGPAWEDSGLVFTNEFGRYVSYRAIFDSFKRIVKRIGLPDARIHDLRHTYAVNCIRAGDDIKTVQSNLGHATAAFTLDVYGHFTDDMRSVSAQRMEGFITNVLNL